MGVKIPYAYSSGKLSVEVKLDHAADVFLVDESNFKKYQRGENFKYYGGHYTTSPLVITVQGIGKWYLVVVGNTKYSYQFF